MKKLIKVMDKAKGIVQITTADERWYVKETKNEITGLPEFKYVPSITWIAGCYPKGIPFYKWLSNQGWDEGQAIKQAAGDKGSKVHLAIEDMIHGKQVKMEDKYLNKSTDQMEELTLEEYDCLMGFSDWVKEKKPKFIQSEFVVFEEKIGYAGTIDCLCELDGKKYIVDFKTSQYIWPEYELQLSAYRQAINIPELGTLILQVGYKRNKHSWKEIIIEDKFDLFLSARKIWENEHGAEKPSQKDYPLEVGIPAELAIKDENGQNIKIKEVIFEPDIPEVDRGAEPLPLKRAAKKSVKNNG